MWLLDAFFPPRCVACRVSGETLCERCLGSLRTISAPLCARCGAPTSWPVPRCRECAGRRLAFLTARAAIAYDGPARPLVRAWKERGLRQVAQLAASIVVERIESPAAAVVTWVPADRDRELTRGHHPAECLARALGRLWEIEPRPLLARTGPSKRQAKLHLDERRRNVRGAFFAREPDMPGSVLLVDDIYTTGATVDAAASVLRAAGSRRVEVVTFARTVR